MAGKWLPAADLTESRRPVLSPEEIECFLISAVEIGPDTESFNTLQTYKSGTLIVTTHRLIWISDAEGVAVYIPLSVISHIFTLKKSLRSMFASPRLRFQLSVSQSGRVEVNTSGLKSMVVTLVMRGKADNHELFVDKFSEAWKGRAWVNSGSGGTSGSNLAVAESSRGGGSLAIRMPAVGVSGILRKEQEMWESTDKSLQDAFQDLNALMSKAKEMVMLAEKMRQKLLSGANNQINASNDEEMGSKEEIHDLLLSVGIISPVTKESAGAMYHQQLSRQLADFVKIPLERAGGMINLIDVYCIFNRARGTACSLWEKFDVPVLLRKFDSGVMVIQNRAHSDEEVYSRIRTLVSTPGTLQTGVSATDAAMTLGIAPAMAKEHLLNAESRGLLCRDISPDGFRFFINLFGEINPNDMYGVEDSGMYASWSKQIQIQIQT